MRDIIKTNKGFVLVIIHINHAQPSLGSPQPQKKENYSRIMMIEQNKKKRRKYRNLQLQRKTKQNSNPSNPQTEQKQNTHPQ